MDSAQDSQNQVTARWYARLRAADCAPEERAEFDAWRCANPRNAAAYAAVKRMNDALTKLAMADPRLKAMVDQAATSGATLPNDEVDEPPAGKPPSIQIAAQPSAAMRPRRVAWPFAWAASVGVAIVSAVALLGPAKAIAPRKTATAMRAPVPRSAIPPAPLAAPSRSTSARAYIST